MQRLTALWRCCRRRRPSRSTHWRRLVMKMFMLRSFQLTFHSHGIILQRFSAKFRERLRKLD
jgi:hypothetical protein